MSRQTGTLSDRKPEMLSEFNEEVKGKCWFDEITRILFARF
jgi:hypothetical protein